MAINSYKELGTYINSILSANQDLPVGGDHKNFWDTLSYDDFINGNVPGIVHPVTGLPMKILVVGDPDNSNLIEALRGTKGSVFDPKGDPDKTIGEMPEGGTEWKKDQIDPIAEWIKNGCQNPHALV
jgi:hypothetical protein